MKKTMRWRIERNHRIIHSPIKPTSSLESRSHQLKQFRMVVRFQMKTKQKLPEVEWIRENYRKPKRIVCSFVRLLRLPDSTSVSSSSSCSSFHLQLKRSYMTRLIKKSTGCAAYDRRCPIKYFLSLIDEFVSETKRWLCYEQRILSGSHCTNGWINGTWN